MASKNCGTLSNAESEGSSQREDYADGIDAITAATGEYDLMLKSLKAELSAEDALNKFVAELQEYNEALSVAGNSTTDFASMLEYLKAASDIGQEFQGLAASLWALGDASVTSGDMVDYASQRVVGLIDAELGLGGTLVAANIDTSAAHGNVLNLLALIRQALTEMAALGAAEGGRNAQGDIILWENGEDADRRLKVIRDGEAAQAALARMDEYEASARTAQTAATNAATKAVDKNTGSTGKNSQAQKEAARTILDYVKDIETVIKTMNDLHFGVLDASFEVASTYEEIALQSARWALNLHDVEDLTDDVLKALYGRQNARDSIADTFESIKKSIEDAKEEYEELIADLADQRASEAQLRYWLGIAQAVGDVAEEQRLLSQLQKNASEQTKTKSEVSQSSVQINFSTTGDSDAARKARSDMQELLSSYLKYIVTMAETGASEKEMAAATAKMRSSFVEQARQLGLNQTEIDALSSAFDAKVVVIKKNATEQAKMNSRMQNAVKAEQSYIVELIKRGASQKEVNAAISAGNQRLADAARQLSLNKDQANFYAQALQGVKTIIDSLPKNINVNINVNAGAATAALNEFYAKEKDRAISQGGAIGGAMGGAIGAGIRGAVKTEADRALKLANKIAEINTSAMMTTAEKSSRINMTYARYEAGYSSFRKGGYTGDFGVNDIAGLVHGQEFVVNATATDKYRTILESMNKDNVSTTHATSAFATGSFALDDRSLYKLGSIILNGINNQRVMVTERAVQTGLSNLGATKAVSLIR